MTDNYRGGNEAQHEEVKKFDQYAHAVTMISEPHRMIHDGFFFTLSGLEMALASAATIDILFQFPVGVVGHMVLVEFTVSDAPVLVEMFRDPTVDVLGAELLPQNHNQVAQMAGTGGSPPATITRDTTLTDDGFLVEPRYVPAIGGPPGQIGGQMVAGENAEWVLGNGHDYMWRLTNLSGGEIVAGWHFNGYRIGYEN
jgi:hypothetical protein